MVVVVVAAAAGGLGGGGGVEIVALLLVVLVPVKAKVALTLLVVHVPLGILVHCLDNLVAIAAAA